MDRHIIFVILCESAPDVDPPVRSAPWSHCTDPLPGSGRRGFLRLLPDRFTSQSGGFHTQVGFPECEHSLLPTVDRRNCHPEGKMLGFHTDFLDKYLGFVDLVDK